MFTDDPGGYVEWGVGTDVTHKHACLRCSATCVLTSAVWDVVVVVVLLVSRVYYYDSYSHESSLSYFVVFFPPCDRLTLFVDVSFLCFKIMCAKRLLHCRYGQEHPSVQSATQLTADEIASLQRGTQAAWTKALVLLTSAKKYIAQA